MRERRDNKTRPGAVRDKRHTMAVCPALGMWIGLLFRAISTE